MQTIGRKLGEAVALGDDVKVTVLAIDGSRVTLGIEAPPNCHIIRGELALRPDEPFIVEVSLSPDDAEALIPFPRMTPR